eukprot:scaffold35523_cov40-Prasinocladus_malaysianus.AAC.1
MDLGWPWAVKVFWAVFTSFALRFELFSPQCLIPEASYLIKLIIVNLLPLLLVPLTALYVWGNRAREARRQRALSRQDSFTDTSEHSKGLLEWCRSPVAAYLALLSLAYTVIADVNLEYFNCQYSHTDAAGRDLFFMVAEPSIECWGAEPNLHSRLLPLVIAALIVYIAGLPLLFLCLLLRERNILPVRSELEAIATYGVGGGAHGVYHDLLMQEKAGGQEAIERLDKAKQRFGFLFRRYDPARFWWELVVMLKKLLITLVRHQLPSASIEQGAFAALIVISYGMSVYRFKPYDAPHLDSMDYVAEAMSMMLSILGLAFLSGHLPESEVQKIGIALMVLSILSIAILVGYIMADTFPRIRIAWTRFRLRRSHEKMMVLNDLMERQRRRQSKWKSVAKRSSTANLKSLVDAAREQTSVQRARKEKAEAKGLDSTFSMRSESSMVNNWVGGQNTSTQQPEISNGEPSSSAGPSSRGQSSRGGKGSKRSVNVDAKLDNSGVGGNNLSLYGRIMRGRWTQQFLSEIEQKKLSNQAEPSTASRSTSVKETSSQPEQGWKRLKGAVALGGMSGQRKRILKYFKVSMPAIDALAYTQAWIDGCMYGCVDGW